MVGGRSARGSRRHGAAASVVVPFPRGAAGARLDLVRFVPSGRSLLVSIGVLSGVGSRTGSPIRRPVFASSASTFAARHPEVAREVTAATRDLVGHEPRRRSTRTRSRALRALPAVAGVSVDRAFPHTLVVKGRPGASGRRRPARQVVVARDRGRQGHPPDRDGHGAALPRLWLAKGTSIRLGGACRRAGSRRPGPRGGPGVGLGARVKGIRPVGDELTLVLRRGTRDSARAGDRGRTQAHRRREGARARRLGGDLRRRQRPAATGRRLSNLQVST